MQHSIWEKLKAVLGADLTKVKPVSGGDIAQAYLIETNTDRLFCKLMNGHDALDILNAEREGLEEIRKTGLIKAPRVFFCKDFGDQVCLGMEFVESKTPTEVEMRKLGEQLAALHKTSSSQFGFHTNNFIGSLPQSNSEHSSWTLFYIQQRLQPQFHMAVSRGLMSPDELPDLEHMIKVLAAYFKGVNPALLHGDLWSGNYLISSAGDPYLIDPAVYYGDPVVDLAMTRLFGGFGIKFYDAYKANAGSQVNEEDKTQLYQLYYLLVHLNLFGRSYYSSVKRIMDRYF